ncbi:hypothetical protein HHI36_008815 [Cryptolaemus montrouzieri]|uniref:Uncharacterized protein n=1 Tax=Cryptolaemus montrouzieri TaxID=559131 RepID=A0ABD2MU25_9CUCU
MQVMCTLIAFSHFRVTMSSSKKLYNLCNDENVKQIYKQLFVVDSESERDREDRKTTPSIQYEVEEVVSDPGQEMIEERIGDSENEQSGDDISFHEETEDTFLGAIRKRGKHVEKFTWEKTPYTKNSTR